MDPETQESPAPPVTPRQRAIDTLVEILKDELPDMMDPEAAARLGTRIQVAKILLEHC